MDSSETKFTKQLLATSGVALLVNSIPGEFETEVVADDGHYFQASNPRHMHFVRSDKVYCPAAKIQARCVLRSELLSDFINVACRDCAEDEKRKDTWKLCVY